MKPQLADIDRYLESLNSAGDDDQLRRLFTTYQARYEDDLPDDPDGPEYRARQFALYEHLYGKPYSTQHEHTPFDVATIARTPFPYSTGSWSTVGNQLIAIGFLIKAMALPTGARILEFGPGWGNTTIALGRMGYEVTAVDIERNFTELISERARMEGAAKVTVKLGDFLSIEPDSGPYDAILFFECFHHCADHQQLISRFDHLLSPNGLVCFAGEPITHDFPIPWGLRMDGESLWAIRKNGWLELGFNFGYFERTMVRHGWRLTQHASPESPWACALIARRSKEPVAQWRFRAGELNSLVGVVDDAGVTADGRAGYLMHGPYATIGRGRYRVQVLLRPEGPRGGSMDLDVVSSRGATVHAACRIDLDAMQDMPEMEFDLAGTVTDLEIRIRAEATTRVALSSIRLMHVAYLEAPATRAPRTGHWRNRIAGGLEQMAHRLRQDD